MSREALKKYFVKVKTMAENRGGGFGLSLSGEKLVKFSFKFLYKVYFANIPFITYLILLIR